MWEEGRGRGGKGVGGCVDSTRREYSKCVESVPVGLVCVV